jgi:selenocysteine lyase/cysteine desulfurase
VGFPPLTVDGWPAALVAQYLSAEHGIGVRDGRFCAHPLLARINPAGPRYAPAWDSAAARTTSTGSSPP